MVKEWLKQNRLILLPFFVFLLLNFFLLLKINSLKKHKLSSCLILEEKFCRQGEEVYIKNKFAGLGFYLPKGTKVFVPYNAGLSLTPTFNFPVSGGYEQYPGLFLTHLDGTKRGLGIAYKKMDLVIEEEREVGQGELLGQIGDEKIDALGDYNLFLSFSDLNGRGLNYSPNNFRE